MGWGRGGSVFFLNLVLVSHKSTVLIGNKLNDLPPILSSTFIIFALLLRPLQCFFSHLYGSQFIGSCVIEEGIMVLN